MTFIPNGIKLCTRVQFGLLIGVNFFKLFSETKILSFGNITNQRILHLVHRH